MTAEESSERLQKALARSGVASRRAGEEFIKAGRVTINGQVATLGDKVRPNDQIELEQDCTGYGSETWDYGTKEVMLNGGGIWIKL